MLSVPNVKGTDVIRAHHTNSGPSRCSVSISRPRALTSTMAIPQQKRSKAAYWIISIIIGFTYLQPYILFGTSSHILIHDNLDACYSWYKLLIESGSLFAPNGTPIKQMFNGLPRESLPSEFDAFALMYWLFGPYGAYVLNRTLMTVVGFFGMYLLLKRHVIPGDSFSMIHFGGALCYALLPFWPFGGLSAAGLPLVVYAFLNIRDKDLRWPNWVILILFPFYSSLVLSGLFLILTLACLWLVDATQKKGNPFFLLGLALISFAYVFTHYRLFAAFFFDSTYTSHRVEFSQVGIDLAGAAREALNLFANGQDDAHGLQRTVILPTVGICAFILTRYSWDRRAKHYVFLLAFIAITAGLYGLLRWNAVSSIMDRLFHWIPVQERFYFLHPMMWTVLFALALQLIRVYFRIGAGIITCVIGAQIILLFSYHELRRNRFTPTIEEFFAVQQFHNIAKYIGRPKESYRVASLGIHPSIAQYNGFYTLDGYIPDYPIQYKHKWRRVIEGEVARNAALKQYYDGWGSRVYLFSSELSERGNYVMNRAGNVFEVQQLRINVEAFQALGGRYVISAVRINERNNPQFELDRMFQDSRSAWDIYLYRIVNAEKRHLENPIH